jgi:hypothetical protein
MDVWSGAAVQGAFMRLHNAEALLIPLLSRRELAVRTGSLLDELQRSKLSDPRLAGAASELQRVQRMTVRMSARRRSAAYLNAILAKHAVLDEQHARVRSFRNITVVAGVALTVIAVGLATAGWLQPTFLPLCFKPEAKKFVCPTGTSGPSEYDVAIVMALGLAGGALASAVAIRGVQGTSTPYIVPLSSAGLKLPAGALTAFFGLLLLQGRFVPGFTALDTQPQVLAYAIVLGYAQQIATRLVDRQANQVLDRVSSARGGGEQTSRTSHEIDSGEATARPIQDADVQTSSGGHAT